MIILESTPLPDIIVDAPVTPLNAVWLGVPHPLTTLPCLGHLFLLCPLKESNLSLSGMMVTSQQYMWLTYPENQQSQPIQLSSDTMNSQVLILMLSPSFIADMADFLNIPPNFQDILYGIPLSKGDEISQLLQSLATAIHNPEDTEELLFEVVGQVLQLLRLRHQTLQSLTSHKHSTIADLLPILLEARQFIESHYLEPIKTRHVADHVALSEYHFTRLFKTAFDVTVHQYVIRLRLDEARRLLESSDKRVTDIALDVGYNSLSAFIHAFRTNCRMTPSAYLARFSSNQELAVFRKSGR